MNVSWVLGVLHVGALEAERRQEPEAVPLGDVGELPGDWVVYCFYMFFLRGRKAAQPTTKQTPKLFVLTF